MTAEQKKHIAVMQLEGRKYSEIAEALGIPLGTVKSFCHRNLINGNIVKCKHCGATIIQKSGHRKKQFCSQECRLTWWKEHPEMSGRKKSYKHICDYCGEQFWSYHASNRYCSRKCYADARRKAASDG